MPGETALDSSMAIRYLNGDPDVVARVTALPIIVLPLTVVSELLFVSENYARPLTNLSRYLQFINACTVVSMGRETARLYSQTRIALKRKGRPIPENDIWIAAIAQQYDLTLVSRDRHFQEIENLKLEIW